jgi:hypothetical protein
VKGVDISLVTKAANAKPSIPKDVSPVGKAVATRFAIVSEAEGKKPSGDEQPTKNITDALKAITKKLESLLDGSISKTAKQPTDKDVAEGGKANIPEAVQLAQATEVAAELVGFLVKFAQAPVGNNLSLIAGDGPTSVSGQIDAPNANDGKVPLNKVGPLMSQLQAAVVLLTKTTELSGQNSTKSGSLSLLATGPANTAGGGTTLGNENPMQAVLGALKFLETMIGQEGSTPKSVVRSFSQNLSLVAGGSKDVSKTKPDVFIAVNNPTPTGMLLAQIDIVGPSSALMAKPESTPQGREITGLQVNNERVKKPQTVGKSSFKVLDPRILNVLSFVIGKAAPIVETGGQTLLLAGFENPGSRENLLAFSSSTFSPLPLISEREFAMALNVSDRSVAASTNSSVEANQGSRFSNAIARQIQSATFGSARTVIQLSPNGLGNIEIEIETNDDGALKVVLRAENMLVLNTLRQDRETVLQALSMANVGSHTTDLEFQEFGKQSQNQAGSNAGYAKFKNGQDGADDGQAPDYIPLIARDQLDILA